MTSRLIVLAMVALISAGCAVAPRPNPAGSPAATAVPTKAATEVLAQRPATVLAVPTVEATRTPAAIPPATSTPLPPVPLPQATPSAAATGAREGATISLRREFAPDMVQGQLNGVERREDGTLAVTKGKDGRYAGQGEVVSAIHRETLPFNDLVLSWNGDAPAGTGLTFYVRVQAGGEWSGWYAMGNWRDGKGASVRGQEDTLGAVEIDTLALRRFAGAWQYRVVFSSSDNARSPSLRSVSVVVADRSKTATGPQVTLPANWARDLPVPVESQAIQDPAVAWEICSPTSLFMVLRFWGVDTTLPTVWEGVRDGGSGGMFGNWPLNTAYAGARGLDAYVTRMYSLDQVRAEIAAGRPVPISVRYQAGQLPGAPLNSTSGHLIVVRGFGDKGEVIVNDPAAPDRASVRRVLRAADLERVWLRSGGVAYMLKPAG